MSDVPCPWKHCQCTHDSGCVAGWIDGPDGAKACPICRPEVARALKAWTPKLERDGRPTLLDGVQRSEMLRALAPPSRKVAAPEPDDDWSPTKVLRR